MFAWKHVGLPAFKITPLDFSKNPVALRMSGQILESQPTHHGRADESTIVKISTHIAQFLGDAPSPQKKQAETNLSMIAPVTATSAKVT